MRQRARAALLIALVAALPACADPTRSDRDPAPPPTDTPAIDPAALPTAALVPLPVLDDASVRPEPWFVELEGEPLSRGGDRASIEDERARFRQAAARASLRLTERRAFAQLWNGLSLRIAPGDLDRLTSLPGVHAVFPVLPVVLDDDPVGPALADPQLFTALTMSGADVAQGALGLTGAKIRVGVIDTGIDYDHPDLGGCFGPGCRVAYGWDFVGDGYNAGDSSTQAVPDPFPDDCAGHGTHVAGIIGASGKIKGVAPAVTFGAYRVFGCTGSTDADVMIAAMEKAEADGMRVVNMSIGTAFQWPEYPTARAADQLAKDGIVVVTSMGNSGAAGLWSGAAPGVGANVIGVASFDNVGLAQPAFTIAPDGSAFGYRLASSAPLAPLAGSAPLVRTGTIDALTDACDPLAPGSLTAAIALIRRGTCTFYAKTKNAEAAGAIGVVLYNNKPGALGATVVAPAGSPDVLVPVVTISDSDGALINAQLDLAPVTLTWTDQVVSVPNPTGNRVSSFSSMGLSPELGFKPDLGAPGGSIYSTFPLELGGYGVLSGTSMSSPHVAGAAALVLQARPGIAAAAVRDLLQSTAVPRPSPADPAGLVLDAVHRQGAGMVRVDLAAQATVTVSPARLALGESQAGPFSAKITLRNAGASAVTYALVHEPAASASGSSYAPLVSLTDGASVQPSVPSLVVPPGSAASLLVTITADPALPQGSLYGGYLRFVPQSGGNVLRVPYAGVTGDYQAIQVLTDGTKGYPWLVKSDGVNLPAGATFTLQNGDLPGVYLHLDHAARRLRFDIVDAPKQKPWGTAIDLSYLGQSGSPSGAISLTWSGHTVFNKQSLLVPNGGYRIKVRVLKALGDEQNPAHWETWLSPIVTINHP
ncbi:MAG: S8 family serine peptidase [Minicystis sp.]